jgi:hypothetical protein
MLDERVIIEQARTGTYPHDWQVLSTRRENRIMRIAQYGIAAMFIYLGILYASVIVVIGLSFLIRNLPILVGNILSETVFINILLISLIAFIMGCIYGIYRIRRAVQNPLPLLVITEDGIVEYINERLPIISIAFEDLIDIVLCVPGSYMSPTHKPRPNSAAYLELKQKDGEISFWSERAQFKSEAEICQDILVALTKYKEHHI